MVDRSELERLERLRWEHPRRVKSRVEKILAAPPLDLLPELLLLYGVTLRQLDRLGEARWAYYAGEEAAGGNRSVLARIFQARSWVEFMDGDFAEALKLLRLAGGIYRELGDRNGGAKVLVDTAHQYLEVGRCQEAVGCAASALEDLREDEYLNRVTAHQLLAGAFSSLQNNHESLANLDAARKLLRHCPRAFTVRYTWQEARLKKDLLPTSSAASVFEKAALYFLEIGEVLDSSLAILECASLHHGLRRLLPLFWRIAFKLDDDTRGRLTASALMHAAEAIENEMDRVELEARLTKAMQKVADARAPAHRSC